MTEEWRDIEGFKGYQVSSMGNVRSCRRSRWYGFLDNWHPLKPRFTGGYLRLCLSRERLDRQQSVGRAPAHFVHVLVLETFVCRRPKGLFASHIDGNRSNNAVSNLCWETQAENEARKYDHGTRFSAEDHPRAKLTNSQVSLARRLHAAKQRNTAQLAREFNVGETTMGHIIARRTWINVP